MSLRNNTSGLNTLKDLINALPEYIDTTGTAVAADIYSGKTATVGGVKLTGTNPYNAANVDPAVADAITALTDKGVDAAGAGLADLAGLIAGISAGAKLYSETRVLAEDATTSYTLQHNLGEIPNFYALLSDAVRLDNGTRYISGFLLHCKDPADYTTFVGIAGYELSGRTNWSTSEGWLTTSLYANGGLPVTGDTTNAGGWVCNASETLVEFVPRYGSGLLTYQAGVEYKFIAGVF